MRRLALVLAASAVLLAGCSSGAPGTSTATASSAPNTIVIKNFMFTPMDLTVAPGTRVTVSNEDTATHTLTSTATPHAFDTGNIAPGKSVTFTAPATAGTYAYICSIHQYMQGNLTVS